MNRNQFGLKWNRDNLFFNIHGEYSISSDYRLPNNQYLFNSRFKQNAIKFTIAHKKNNLQNIFRYQLHNESPGIPGHVHGDPSTVELTQLLSSDIDFNTEVSASKKAAAHKFFKVSIATSNFDNPDLKAVRAWNLVDADASAIGAKVLPQFTKVVGTNVQLIVILQIMLQALIN